MYNTSVTKSKKPSKSSVIEVNEPPKIPTLNFGEKALNFLAWRIRVTPKEQVALPPDSNYPK